MLAPNLDDLEAHGPSDVFKVSFAEIDEAGFNPPTHVLVDRAEYQHPAGFAETVGCKRQLLQLCDANHSVLDDSVSQSVSSD
jgi:hypothetical protein